MKTAISIPNRLFAEAERAARRLKLSRSALFARAVAEFLVHRRREGVTERLNRVYAKHPSGLDPVLAKIQALSLPKEKW